MSGFELSAIMENYINLLKSLISAPSFSRDEQEAAALIRQFLTDRKVKFHSKMNNTWVKNRTWKEGLPVILLNSHIDTVKPAGGYTRNPFSPDIEGDILYGLGSNDAGGPLVTLLAVFIHFNQLENLPFNLIYAATAEEEISGLNGLESILDELGPLDLAIVGRTNKNADGSCRKGTDGT